LSLPSFSVRRPVFTTMVSLMTVVLGLISYYKLRIDLLPAVEVPNLSVSTTYEGADPEVVERKVTSILEEVINTVPGVTELTSTSVEGRSDIRASFGWGTDLNVAAMDVRARIEEEMDELPDEVGRPQIRKFDVASFPVVVLGVASNALDPVSLNDLVERQIRYRFARLEGVAQVDLWGGYEREVRVELDPDRVAALGLDPSSLLGLIRRANQDLPVGSVEDGRFEVVLRAPSELESLEEIEDLVIEMRNGVPITLGQVGKVVDTYTKLNRVVRVNEQQGIRVAIRKEADANTVEVAQRILAEIDRTNEDLPQVRVTAVINQGNFIERSIVNVANSVLFGGGLAILILLFFLRSVRSTITIAVSIPLSILFTLALAYWGGLTLNLMTLGGLALGVGMMVDSSIVVLENIYRRRDEEGEDATSAAVSGSLEVAMAIVASTVTTLVIFLPMVFVEGVAGLLFGELALVVVYSLCASLIVSLTLVPMMASKLLGGQKKEKEEHLLARKARQLQESLEESYRGLLVWALGHRALVILFSLLSLGGSVALNDFIGSEFMPPSDEGEVRVSVKFEAGTQLELADRLTRRMEILIRENTPEIKSMVSSTSSGGRSSGTTADINLNVGSSATRKRSNTEISKQLRSLLVKAIPGVDIRTRAPQGQFLLERLLGGNDGIRIDIRGPEMDRLEELSKAVVERVKTVSGVTKAEGDVENGVPQEHFSLNRAKIADLGLEVETVLSTLETSIGGRSAGDFRPEGFSIPIRVQLAGSESLSIERVLSQTLPLPGGGSVTLGNLIEHKAGEGPSRIARRDQERSVTVSIDVEGRPAGDVAEEIQEELKDLVIPFGYDVRVRGSYEEQQKAFGELLISFFLALLLVFMVLACQYESLKDPLVVMFSVPMSAIGVMVTLFLTDSTFNLQSGIGCIMLGGIVVNNAILLVDQASSLRAEGKKAVEAMIESGRRRLRPILMTTVTTILGLIPLAFGIGEGADAQAPLARAVVGGLISSTLITLLLIPVIYTLFHPEREKVA